MTFPPADPALEQRVRDLHACLTLAAGFDHAGDPETIEACDLCGGVVLLSVVPDLPADVLAARAKAGR